MPYAQYCRIEAIAGGCWCSNREFIRACRSRLAASGKTRASREARQAWIRAGLEHLEGARNLCREFSL